MKKIKEKIVMFISWHLPPSVLMWAYVRAMALTWSKLDKNPDEITYSEVYKTIKEEFKLKEF